MNMHQRILALVAFVGLLLMAGGCTTIKLDVAGATPATLEKLRTGKFSPAQTGKFELAPGKNPDMDTRLGVRAGVAVPAKGSFAQLLKDTLVTELSAAGLYDTRSKLVIEGQLTDSTVDAGLSVGTGRLAARFKVLDTDRVVFDKELAAEATWESSFIGSVAIPAAIGQYDALYKALVAKLVDDPDFRKALTRP